MNPTTMISLGVEFKSFVTTIPGPLNLVDESGAIAIVSLPSHLVSPKVKTDTDGSHKSEILCN